MLYRNCLVSTLALGGLLLGAQQAGATVAAQNSSMLNDGGVINGLEHFAFGGPFTEELTALSDGNQFMGITHMNDFSGAGFSWHLPTSAITDQLPLTDGMTLRLSLWLASDPASPWQPLASDGLKFEFYNVELGSFNTPDMTNDTENGFGLGLTPIADSLSTTAWSQHSFTVPITDALVDFGTLAEVRAVWFTGDFTGSAPPSGRVFADNLLLEVFPDLATANGTALPNNMPGAFDLEDLSGDINGDGFVGIEDLNIVLGTWNNGTPPPPGSPTIPEPASLTLLGLGGLVMLRRR